MFKLLLRLVLPTFLLAGEPVLLTKSPTPVPQHLLYRALFRHVIHLDKAAAREDASGRNGSELRSYYKRSAMLSDPEEAALKKVAAECDAAVDQQDKKAGQIVRRIRAQYTNGHLISKSALPPVPQELKDLQLQRDDLIRQQIENLKQALGTDAFQKLDKFVQAKFAPQVTVLTIPSPPPTKRIPNKPFPDSEGGNH